MIREIVTIDEELCDGCGLCVPACHEGAIRIVNGKAKLVSDRLCDGLGDCLGHCPQGAITIERREANEFDEAAVAAQTAKTGAQHSSAGCPGALARGPAPAGGCPGSRLMTFGGGERAAPEASAGGEQATAGQRSALTHWPVKLRLLPAVAPILREARLLVAADCVPVACADFHARLLRDRAVVIGCPKFDDLESYTAKLTDMLRANALREIVVARMEVPCCAGIVYAVQEARRRAGVNVQVTEAIIGTRGQILAERPLAGAAAD